MVVSCLALIWVPMKYIRLSESDYEESEESADIIDNNPVNPDLYIFTDVTEGITHKKMFLLDLRLETFCDKAIVPQAS
ncbi:hypothetical protein TNCV_4601251 [Trichonephila clavipes]|nr:hypothetical protein TNCV_4601251 [Trichonephila clavipes]